MSDDHSNHVHLYDYDEVLVCTTHRRFIPCRFDDGFCKFSGTPDDVKRVSEYQNGFKV